MKDIERRILDAVIKMVHVRKWTPKVLYLDPSDHAEWLRARRGSDLHDVGGIEVRPGQHSRLFATHGYSGVTVAKRAALPTRAAA